jgi:hypothetical protein
MVSDLERGLWYAIASCLLRHCGFLSESAMPMVLRPRPASVRLPGLISAAGYF